MATKEKLTAAESTLSTMATVVLVLGIIASIFVFAFSCLSWEFTYSGGLDEVNGINWMGFPTLIYCIMATLISWSVLSVIVEISVNVRSGKEQTSSDWKKDFAISYVSGKNDTAKEILYRAILESDEFKKVMSGGNETYHQQCVDELNRIFRVYLEKIGEGEFKYTQANEILNVFK